MKVPAVLVLSLTIFQKASAFPRAVRISLYFLFDPHSRKNSQQAFNDPEIHQRLARRYGADVASKRDVDTGENDLSTIGDDSLADIVNGLLNGSLPGATLPSVTIPGLGPIAIEVPPVVAIGRKVIPDADHPFQDPPQGAQRGGCPGLNSKSL